MKLIRTLKAQAVIELRKIIRAEYRAGDRLPPESRLAERVGVSRNTVREALADLVVEGFIERRWGVGTIVREPSGPVTVSLTDIISVRQIIHGHGKEATLPHAEVVPIECDETLAGDLGIDVGTSLWQVERVFAVDGVPAVLMRDYAPTRYHERDFDPRPLVDIEVAMLDVVREHAGQAITRMQGNLEAVVATGSLTTLLDVAEGHPLVRVVQACLSARESVLLHTEVHYRTDVITLGLARTVR